jgi:hypothetical protein
MFQRKLQVGQNKELQLGPIESSLRNVLNENRTMDNVQRVCTSKTSYSNTQSAGNMFLLAPKICTSFRE